MRSRIATLLAVLAVCMLALVTMTAARPAPPKSDSVVAVHVDTTQELVRDSLPSLSFRVADSSIVDSALSVRATLASHSTPVHDAAFDSAVERSFVPVTFVVRPARSRIILPLHRLRRDSIGEPLDDSGAG